MPASIATTLTAADHGRRMSLAEFENAETTEGLRVELARGVIEVSEIPGIEHSDIEERFRDLLAYYRREHAGLIRKVGTGSSSKLIIDETGSERHPDLSVYLTDPPAGDQPWREWMPEIVVEIVSESSRRRDYVDKTTDYWLAGVDEYWLIDPQQEQVQRCYRAEASPRDWTISVLRQDQALATALLHGFAITPAALFTSRR